MNERDKLFLNHVLSAIAEIESFTTDGRGGFMADRSMVEQDLPTLRANVQGIFAKKSEPKA